jgi:predicted glycoside hydrolase/deacetylase ChbG (UPF0249 family)
MNREAERFQTSLDSVTAPKWVNPPASDGVVGHAAHWDNSRALIVNADDWGRDRATSDRTIECCRRGTVSSVSGMVFMEDSERAAAIAGEQGIDVGLHLNLTTPFSGPKCSTSLVNHQNRIAKYLRGHRFAGAIYHPLLTQSFEYVVSAQFDEFLRLYGVKPERIDGHHHMHLSVNVLLAKLLPTGTTVRRNFSFQLREKSWSNCFYRRTIDRLLVSRHRLTDFYFSLLPLEPPTRLQRIFSLACESIVEVGVHTINPDEYRFLTCGEIIPLTRGCPIATRFAVGSNGKS